MWAEGGSLLAGQDSGSLSTCPLVVAPRGDHSYSMITKYELKYEFLYVPNEKL